MCIPINVCKWSHTHFQVLEAWGRLYPRFDKVLDAYKRFVQDQTGDKRTPVFYTEASWKNWFQERAYVKRYPLALARFAMVTADIISYETATFDGTFFCTQAHQENKRFDNKWVEEVYKDTKTGQQVHSYGRIFDIFVHRLPCTEETNLDGFLETKHRFTDSELQAGPWTSDVFINCDWYSPLEPIDGVEQPFFEPISGLPQVSYDAGLSLNSRIAFLKYMYCHNIVLWPANGPDYDFDCLESDENRLHWLVLHKHY